MESTQSNQTDFSMLNIKKLTNLIAQASEKKPQYLFLHPDLENSITTIPNIREKVKLLANPHLPKTHVWLGSGDGFEPVAVT